MKTKKQIEDEIKKIESDERYKYEPAIVQVNAPLALIQCGMKNQVHILRWVLQK